MCFQLNGRRLQSLFSAPALLSLHTNYRHYWLLKRLPVYAGVFFSFTLSRGPDASPRTPAAEQEMKAKIKKIVADASFLSTWSSGFDASQVMEGIF